MAYAVGEWSNLHVNSIQVVKIIKIVSDRIVGITIAIAHQMVKSALMLIIAATIKHNMHAIRD